MDRRALLATVGAAVLGSSLAGCVRSSSLPGLDAPTTLPDSTPAIPDGPTDPPEIPGDLTAETAGSFAREYERRWVYNRLWSGENTHVSVSCDVEDVSPIPEGYRIRVSCRGSATTYPSGGETGDPDETTTVLHADYFETPRVYLVDPDSVVRQSPDED